MPHKFLEHTADVKIQAGGKSLEEAFSEAALALKEVMLDYEKIKIKPEKSRLISAEGKDLGDLLYNFLEEFIYLIDAENFILSEIEDIEISEIEGKKEKSEFLLSAKILGDKASNYKFTNKVKAVTFNEMIVKKEKNKYALQFVLDV